MKITAEQVAAQRFTRRRADGSIAEWQQEDEAAVASKDEAVAIVQRTINFWIPKIAADLRTQKGLPMRLARPRARQVMQEGLKEMLSKPFARRWGLTMEDFNFNVRD
jgi:hypothetical protein